jgi:hypothetical protein
MHLKNPQRAQTRDRGPALLESGSILLSGDAFISPEAVTAMKVPVGINTARFLFCSKDKLMSYWTENASSLCHEHVREISPVGRARLGGWMNEWPSARSAERWEEMEEMTIMRGGRGRLCSPGLVWVLLR